MSAPKDVRIMTTCDDTPCGEVPCPCGENAEAMHFDGNAAVPEGYLVRCLECGREGYPHDSPTLAAENFRTRHPVEATTTICQLCEDTGTRMTHAPQSLDDAPEYGPCLCTRGVLLDLEHRMTLAKDALVQRLACPECRHPDGTINAEWASENGSCLFGCNHIVPTGYGDWNFCPKCKEHSRNEAICERCGATYQFNDTTWEKV
jgi:uncharacterized protein YbaR (Trm112 family)